MPRKPVSGHTDAELEIMNVLWVVGPCTSDTIRMSLPGKEARKDSTIRTLLAIMEKKGHVSHEVSGRAYIYRPLIGRESAQRSAAKDLVEKVFQGSPKLLLQCLLDSKDLDAQAILEIETLLKQTHKNPRN